MGLEFRAGLVVFNYIQFFWARLLTPEHSRRRLWLWIGIIANVTLLSFYKLNESEYAARFGLTTKFLLPIGLAFYTLQAISYLVDVYNKVLPPTSNWADFFLYLSYFPKLLAGPIERARNFLPTLAKPRVVTNEKLAKAVALIMIGLFRKIVIADVLSQLIVLEKAWVGWGANYSSPVLILWLLSFAFALYNDFAGYTSIVRGVSFSVRDRVGGEFPATVSLTQLRRILESLARQFFTLAARLYLLSVESLVSAINRKPT